MAPERVFHTFKSQRRINWTPEQLKFLEWRARISRDFGNVAEVDVETLTVNATLKNWEFASFSASDVQSVSSIMSLKAVA